MSRSFALGLAPVLFAVSPLLAQSYYAPPPPAAYGDPNGQPQDGDDRADAAPQAPRYQPREDAPPPGYYRHAPQAQPPYGYYQPEPQRRPAYADNNSAAPRAPYARYDYGRQPDYYAPQPDYGRRPVYQQPQRAPAPQPEAEPPAGQVVAPVAAPVAAAPTLAPAPVAAVDPLDQAMWNAAKRANGVQGYTVYLDRYPSGAHSQEAEAAIDQLQQELQPTEQAATQENGAPVTATTAAVAATAAPVAAAEVAAPIKLASAGTALPTIRGLPMKAVETAPVPVAPAASVDAAPAKPVIAAAAPAAAQPAAFMCRPAFQGAVPYDQADSAEIAAYLQATRVNSVAAYQTYLAAYPHGVFTGEVQEVVAARQGRMSQLAAAGLTPAAAHAQAKVTLTAADYPAVALRDGQQGTAVASWEVAEDGCVESCKIDRSSGSSALDAATCNVITERGRYDPAFGAQGKPVRATETAQLTWNLPQR